jgi:hypothetical protein
MGLTIHYRGRISDKQKLPLMIEELEEIAKVRGWKYHIFETKFPQGNDPDDKPDGNLYGITMSPPGCEPVEFSFASNGRMCGPMQLSCWGNSTDETEQKYLYMNSTKTQYAGAETHKMIIGIFRFVVSHYLTDFKMIDEAEYWETGDENLLIENFRRNTELINSFAKVLQSNAPHDDEDVVSYLERIIREFKGKKDKMEPTNTSELTTNQDL